MGGFTKFLGPLKGPFFSLINSVLKSKLGKTAEDLGRMLEALSDIVLEQVLAAQANGGSNDEKHKQVAAKVIAIVKEPGGVELPAWALDFLAEYLDDLIKFAVDQAKSRGLFPS